MQYEEIIGIDALGCHEDHRIRCYYDCHYMQGHYIPIVTRTEKVYASGRTTDAGDIWNWLHPDATAELDKRMVRAWLAERGMTVERATCQP